MITHLALTIGLLGDCTHIDDPVQVLDLFLDMDPADWAAVRNDETFEVERPASFHACDEAPLPVTVRRKKSRPDPGDPQNLKIPLKIDFNDRVPDGEWHGHRKLSLEDGGGFGLFMVLREGLAWQILHRSGLVTGSGPWVNLTINGVNTGVYTRVEEVDKSFLRRHLDEDDGFLFKFEPALAEQHEQLTRTGETDPLLATLCYLPFSFDCPTPPGALAELPRHVDMHQLLTMAAVNAFISNPDAPFATYNNFYWYDSVRPRMYFPWDLDLVFLDGFETRDPHGQDFGSPWYDLLSEPTYRERYDSTILRLVNDVFTHAEVDRLIDDAAVAVSARFDADPTRFVHVPSSFHDIAEPLRTWMHTRIEFLKTKLPPWEPPSLVINEVLASNAETNEDEGHDHDDWVEIFNRGREPASLLGLSLSDDPAQPRKWMLPDVAVPAGGYVLVWCDRELDEGKLHADFQLDAGGEAVGLYEVLDRAPPGLYRTIDFVRFGQQEVDVSIARFPNGTGGFRATRCPTPGEENRADCSNPSRLFVRGDADDSGRLEITDAIRILAALFQGGAVGCWSAADANDDGAADVSDAVAVLAYLFQGHPAPPAPYPSCGSDPTADDLGCASAGRCGGG